MFCKTLNSSVIVCDCEPDTARIVTIEADIAVSGNIQCGLGKRIVNYMCQKCSAIREKHWQMNELKKWDSKLEGELIMWWNKMAMDSFLYDLWKVNIKHNQSELQCLGHQIKCFASFPCYELYNCFIPLSRNTWDMRRSWSINHSTHGNWNSSWYLFWLVENVCTNKIKVLVRFLQLLLRGRHAI